MLLKLLKLKANEAIRSGASAISRSGRVTRRKTWKVLAPSTRAASCSSYGIDWSAPSETRNMYGTRQPGVTMITETFAQNGSKSHGTFERGRAG